MRRRACFFLLGLLVLETTGAHAGQYIVKFRGAGGRAAVAAARGRMVRDFPARGAMAAELSEAAVAALRRHPQVAYVEPDPLRVPFAQEVPYGIGLVEADLVSDEFAGNRTLCVIDSGVHFDHADLPQGVTVSGDDFADTAPWSVDGCGHGTHVTGTLVALDNDIGVVGVLPHETVRVHIVKIFDDRCGYTRASTLVAALDLCREAGAHVVNMSLGGPNPSVLEEEAFDRALHDHDILPVAAAGNDGCCACEWPACYPSVVSVAAVDATKRVADFSQRNTEVELAAPGVRVLSTAAPKSRFFPQPFVEYATVSGTSMATAHVAGVAALVWSHVPGASAIDVRLALAASAEDLGAPGRDMEYGFGLVRAAEALAILTAGNTTTTSTATTTTTTTLACSPPGAACDRDAECCSGKCRGRAGEKACRLAALGRSAER